jgi:hypothetical protein
MRIHLRFLRESDSIQKALLRDGWALESERDDSITAQHPLVRDETDGRHRLHLLGLLTTTCARIRFDRAGRRTRNQ